ncbi:MAG: DUF2127 domain-containing protein, partial [bacterium]
MRRRPDILIRLIAAFKLLKGGMLIALGIGALSMRHHHDGWVNTWVHALAADPHGRYLTEILARVTSFDAHQLRQIGIGSLAYASVFLVEGVGLLLRKPWAEIMTVIVTTSFIRKVPTWPVLTSPSPERILRGFSDQSRR